MPDYLTIGPNITIAVNTVYAMPARSTRGYTDASGLETNSTNSTTGWLGLTVTAGEFSTAAPFIRCTTGAAVVRLVAL